MKRDRLDWLVWILVILKFAFITLAAYGVIVAAKDVMHPKPGPEWQPDHGSIYWTCTRDGHALIRDTDTSSTMLDRDDRKCDSGG